MTDLQKLSDTMRDWSTTAGDHHWQAHLAIQELIQAKAQVEQLHESSLLAFGDGFYDGYLHYAKLCGDLEFTDDAMRQSELAEAESVYGKSVGSSVRVAEIKAQAVEEAIKNGITVGLAHYTIEQYANQLRQQAKVGE